MAHSLTDPQEVVEVRRMLFHSGIQYDEDVVDTILTLQNQLLTEVVTEAKAVCQHQGKRIILPEHITFACGVSKRRARRKFSRLPVANLKKLSEHIDARGWPEPSKRPSALRLPSLQNCLAQPTYVIKHDLRDEDVQKKLADPNRGEKKESEPSSLSSADDRTFKSATALLDFKNHVTGLPQVHTALPVRPTHMTSTQGLPVNMQTTAVQNAAHLNNVSLRQSAFSTSFQSHAPLITYASTPSSVMSLTGASNNMRQSTMPLMSSQQQGLPVSMNAGNIALGTSSTGWVPFQMMQPGMIPINRQQPPHAPLQLQYLQPGGNFQGFAPNQLFVVPGPNGQQLIVQSNLPLANDGNMMMSQLISSQPSSMPTNAFRPPTSLPLGIRRQNSHDYLPLSNHSLTINNNQIPVSLVAAAAVSTASNPTQDVNLDSIF